MTDDDTTADLLKRALDEEAQQVDPAPGGLQMIQQRTQQTHSTRMPWILGALGAGLATAAVVTTVVLVTNNGSGDGGATQPAGQTTSAPVADVSVDIWFVGPRPDNPEGPGPASPETMSPLQRETHTVVSTDDKLEAVHEFFSSGPIDGDYTTGWPAGVDVSAVTVTDDGIATIDLVGDADISDPNRVLPGEAKSAIQAPLFTIGDVSAGTFTYNGEPVDSIFGVDTSKPVTIEDENFLGAAFIFDDLVDGQTVTTPVTLTMSVNSFEGNMLWRLKDESGTDLDNGQVTGSMGMYTQVPVELGDLDPGTYTIQVLDFSPADGGPYGLDDKTFTVE